MTNVPEMKPLPELKFPTFWQWVLWHGLIFSVIGLLDWHFNEIYLPRNHSLLTLPVGLGILQGYLLRGCLKKSYLLAALNPLGILIAFFGVWWFPALIGIGFGIVHAIFWRLQGYRRTNLLVPASFAGWILGAMLWNFLPSTIVMPGLVNVFWEPLAQPGVGAGMGYAICTYFAMRLLRQPAR